MLAPGSVAARPPIEGLDLPGVVFSTGALQIGRVPERFVVIGGGVIGMEFACIYEALGSRVTVLETARTILPAGVDETIAQRLQSLLRRRGIDIRVGIDVKAIEADRRRTPRRDPGPRRRIGRGGRPGTRRHRATAKHLQPGPVGVRAETE